VSLGYKGTEMLGIKLYSTPEKLLEIANTEYFWPESLMNPDNLPEFEDLQVLEMMRAMEPTSWFDRPVDQLNVVSNQLYGSESKHEMYINVLLPTSLKDVLGLELENKVDLCLRDDCRMRFRARVVGFMNKVPMFLDIRSYRPNAYTSPGVIVTETQMDYILETYFAAFPEEKRRIEPRLDNGRIPHARLALKISPEASAL